MRAWRRRPTVEVFYRHTDRVVDGQVVAGPREVLALTARRLEVLYDEHAQLLLLRDSGGEERFSLEARDGRVVLTHAPR